jgi:hypothetical protein
VANRGLFLLGCKRNPNAGFTNHALNVGSAPVTKDEAIAHTEALLREQGLADWRCVIVPRAWNRRRHHRIPATTVGFCDYLEKEIIIKEHHLSDDDLTDTIKHEVAHALVPNEQGHGPEWKAAARKLGLKNLRALRPRPSRRKSRKKG